ncbi:MAG: prepilin-type N-terminal cleavage/methylation domain-containing protein, partial [Solirubrobacterales bacterium]
MNRLTNRSQLGTDLGFSLPELLVVVLFLGILTGIAVPSFLGQRDKARDACVKAQLRAAYTAGMTYAVGNDASFENLDVNALNSIDRSLPTVATNGCLQSAAFSVGDTAGAGATCAGVPDRNSFCVYLRLANNVSYNIVQGDNGSLRRECAVPVNTAAGG